MLHDIFLTLGRAARRGRCVAIAMTAVLIALAPGMAAAQFLMMPDSTNNRLVVFNEFNGAVVNANLFGLAAGTPIEALQVGNEIWISEQIGDRVSRWSLTGTPLGQLGGGPAGGLDNVRGMGIANGVLHVSNAGAANGAPGAALVRYSLTGAPLGALPTASSSSPFDVIDFQGGLLVSSSNANDDLHRYSYAGASVGTFSNGATLNFAEQIDVTANGQLLVAGFSSNNVVRFDAGGNIVSSFTASGARGVWELGNGNILWTSGAGASIYDQASGSSTLVYAGGGRFLAALVPEPATYLMWAAGLLLMLGAARGRR
ncbi:MAG: hypothetical protein H7Z19_01360 [Chitinophagaceae bacterium]|nr:hypothetical protein [Rubrivivax sp.]